MNRKKMCKGLIQMTTYLPNQSKQKMYVCHVIYAILISDWKMKMLLIDDRFSAIISQGSVT